MKEDGKSIIIITHKLHEVMALTDRVAVLRKGEYIGTVDTKTATEQSLTEMMVGKKVSLNIERTAPVNPQDRIELKNVTTLNAEGAKAIDNLSFTIRSGEILGIAGIAGSGQRELLECITGLYPVEHGTVTFLPEGKPAQQLIGKTPNQIRKAGVAMAFVPVAKVGNSKTPMGPFHTIVPAPLVAAQKSSTVLGPMSMPIISAGMCIASTTWGSASAANSIAATVSTGSRSLTPFCLAFSIISSA